MTGSDQGSPAGKPADDPARPAVISVTEARRLVLAGIAPLAPRRAVIGDATGHVLAETVLAAEAVPRFANSAVDGYAARRPDAGQATGR